MAAQGGQKPPDPMCPMCGSALAKSQAGMHVLGKVSQSMASKVKPPSPRGTGPGMSAPMVPPPGVGMRRY
jgi:hypothetical protein